MFVKVQSCYNLNLSNVYLEKTLSKLLFWSDKLWMYIYATQDNKKLYIILGFLRQSKEYNTVSYNCISHYSYSYKL